LAVEAFRKIDISIDEPFSQELSEGWLGMVVDCALQVALPPDAPGQVSLLVADDATVRDLNREYRGLDEVTDVLSFSTSHPGHWEGEAEAPDDRYLKPGLPEVGDGLPFVLPPDELPILGDIVVSYPQAQRQASARHPDGSGLARELTLLIIHGVLHLVGHDHLEPEETALMQAKEQAALSLALSSQLSAFRPVLPGSGEADGLTLKA